MATSSGTEPPLRAGEDYLRVLLTGFGPSGTTSVNPSWLAVEPLKDTVIPGVDADGIAKEQREAMERKRQEEEVAKVQEAAANAKNNKTKERRIAFSSEPDENKASSSKSQTMAATRTAITVTKAEKKVEPPAEDKPLKPIRPILISAMQVPLKYEGTEDFVAPLFEHAPRHPEAPLVPHSSDHNPPYDFIFHIGSCGRGPLRVERLGHKTGYAMKDAFGGHAPLIPPKRTEEPEIVEQSIPQFLQSITQDHHDFDTHETPAETIQHREKRGHHGTTYDLLDEELHTEVDVSGLVLAMKATGFEIYASMDGGHWVGDFLYYASLTAARRHHKPYEKRRLTQVLFLHCPPVNQPLSTQEVSEAIKRIIVWVCAQVENIDEQLEQEAQQAASLSSKPIMAPIESQVPKNVIPNSL